MRLRECIFDPPGSPQSEIHIVAATTRVALQPHLSRKYVVLQSVPILFHGSNEISQHIWAVLLATACSLCVRPSCWLGVHSLVRSPSGEGLLSRKHDL